MTGFPPHLLSTHMPALTPLSNACVHARNPTLVVFQVSDWLRTHLDASILTWHLEQGKYQTPSTSGQMGGAAPGQDLGSSMEAGGGEDHTAAVLAGVCASGPLHLYLRTHIPSLALTGYL